MNTNPNPERQEDVVDWNTYRTNLLDHARQAHAPYPQYEGYYDLWTLAQTTRRIRTKGGTDVPAGTVVLANLEREDVDGIGPCATFYDPSTTHNVLVDADHLVAFTPTVLIRHPQGLVWFEVSA